MVVGWDQISGSNPVLYFDTEDHGKNIEGYTFHQSPDHIVRAKGMNNHFVRLEGLQPNTTYYFVIKDSDGVGPRLSFRTAPATADVPLSIIAGGDSRNNRKVRLQANKTVGLLRPHFVMFSGDMTAEETSQQWMDWLDDWQYTIGKDARLTPIVVARGNHEKTNQSLIDIFDVKADDLYYSLTFGGDLLTVFTLNSLIPAGGKQKGWLESSLAESKTTWKFAQYHHSIVPHTKSKSDQLELLVHWAKLFAQYGVNIAFESDAHLNKWTWPIVPESGPDGEGGFKRDDQRGTVYVGEGGWGAPLRKVDDNKSWTRASASFNQFKWVWVSNEKVDVRVVKIKSTDGVLQLSDGNIFREPKGLDVWSPPSGKVLTLMPKKSNAILSNTDAGEGAGEVEKDNWSLFPVLEADANGKVRIKYELKKVGNVDIVIIDDRLQEITRASLTDQKIGPYAKTLNLSSLASGRYLVMVMRNNKPVKRYRFTKA